MTTVLELMKINKAVGLHFSVTVHPELFELSCFENGIAANLEAYLNIAIWTHL